jgi:hypothetical protein
VDKNFIILLYSLTLIALFSVMICISETGVLLISAYYYKDNDRTHVGGTTGTDGRRYAYKFYDEKFSSIQSEIKFDNLLLVVLTVLIMNIRDLVRPIPRLPAYHWLESRWPPVLNIVCYSEKTMQTRA